MNYVLHTEYTKKTSIKLSIPCHWHNGDKAEQEEFTGKSNYN